jgi:hypothetical protein
MDGRGEDHAEMDLKAHRVSRCVESIPHALMQNLSCADERRELVASLLHSQPMAQT